MSFLIASYPSEPQAVCHYTYAAEGHRGGTKHRVELGAGQGVEDAGGHRYGEYVVDECPEEILTDYADGEGGEVESLGDF